MLIGSCFISILLFFLFETNGLIEYAKVLNLAKFLPQYDSYANIINDGGNVHYLQYIRRLDSRFLFQLITCPICLSVPISIFISFFLGGILNSIIFIFFGLLGYFTLKIAKKISE